MSRFPIPTPVSMSGAPSFARRFARPTLVAYLATVVLLTGASSPAAARSATVITAGLPSRSSPSPAFPAAADPVDAGPFDAGPCAAPVSYIAPIVAPVIDPFRPPTSPYGPGNRGIEYATVPGSPVVAAADGYVSFAGQVAGSLHVTVQHPDGVRVTASFLATALVVAGARVVQGQVIGTSADRLHVSARRGDVYFDPASLWADGPPHVYLVPLDGGGPIRPGTPRTSGNGASRWGAADRPAMLVRRPCNTAGSGQPHSPGSTLGRHRRRIRDSSNRREGSVA
jgi:murein DD-endopeptidase MepM/ murein hydrolase activator NlpD